MKKTNVYSLQYFYIVSLTMQNLSKFFSISNVNGIRSAVSRSAVSHPTRTFLSKPFVGTFLEKISFKKAVVFSTIAGTIYCPLELIYNHYKDLPLNVQKYNERSAELNTKIDKCRAEIKMLEQESEPNHLCIHYCEEPIGHYLYEIDQCKSRTVLTQKQIIETIGYGFLSGITMPVLYPLFVVLYVYEQLTQ